MFLVCMYVCIIFISLKHGYTFINEKRIVKKMNECIVINKTFRKKIGFYLIF